MGVKKNNMKKYNHFVDEIEGFEDDEITFGKFMFHMSVLLVLVAVFYIAIK